MRFRHINNITYIPLRAVIESMGGTVMYYPDGNYDKISCRLNDHYIEMWVNYDSFYVNGTEYYFNSPPQIIDGHTMIPLRSILEPVGCTVIWDDYADNWNGRITIEYTD